MKTLDLRAVIEELRADRDSVVRAIEALESVRYRRDVKRPKPTAAPAAADPPEVP